MKRKYKVLASVSAVVLASCGTAGYFLSRVWAFIPASLELPRAAEAYRRAGFYWEASQLNPSPPIPPDQNAAPFIIEAAREADWSKLNGEVNRGDLSSAMAAIKPLAKALGTVKAASLRPHLDFHRDRDRTSDSEYPEFKIKYMVDVLCVSARIEAKEERPVLALEDLAAARRLCRLIGDDVSLITMLIQIACDAVTLRTFERIATVESSDPVVLGDLSNLLAQIPVRPDIVSTLKSEAYFNLASMRNMPTQYWTDWEKDPDAAQPKISDEKIRRTGYPDSIAGRAMATRVLEAWTEMGVHFKEVQDDPRTLDGVIKGVEDRLERHEEPSYLAAKITFPAYSQTCELAVKEQAQYLCTEALLAR